MSEEKIGKILVIVSKYINEYKNSEVVDYYSLFNLDRTQLSSEISKQLKKLFRLFHPDNCVYLPEFIQEPYQEVLNEFINCRNIFSSMSQREKYDKKLNNYNKNENNSNKEQTYNNNYSQNSQEYKENNEEGNINGEDLEKVRNIIITSIIEEGLSPAMYYTWAIFKGVPFIAPAKMDSELRTLGEKKFIKIIKAYSETLSQTQLPEDVENEEFIINYLSYLYKYDEEFKDLVSPFKKVCAATANKYGKSQMKHAITEYVINNNTKYFTNDNDYRNLLRKKFCQEEIVPLMTIYINSFRDENNIYSYRKYARIPEEYIIEIFSNKFYEEEVIKKHNYNNKW